MLIDTEHHFRISAGPGAGKTHWLIEHIKNILHRSKRLNKTRKIACITYTNTAVETIFDRLSTSAEKVEVSTIHSFLYRHIVKPYSSFVADEYGLNSKEIDGHDDLNISFGKIKFWIENHPKRNELIHPFSQKQLIRLSGNREALSRWLNTMKFQFINEELQLVCDNREAYYSENGYRRFLSNSCLALLKSDFLSLKKLFWEKGQLHHDDVLFFANQIIQRYPFVLDVLRAKFPYFFVDEFQDSNPIQVRILIKIATKETIVGIIGDRAQSIYGFQGADSSQFYEFMLPNLTDYYMSINRRSTNKIINLLNRIRSDISQMPFRNEEGLAPLILIGPMDKALQKAKSICVDQRLWSLSRDNITSNAMKRELDGYSLNDHLFDEFERIDSSKERKRYVSTCLIALEYAKEQKFKESLRELEKVSSNKNKVSRRKKALNQLLILLPNYHVFKDGSLFDFYEFLKNNLNMDLSNFRTGPIKDFYEQTPYQNMALCVKIPEDTSYHKTIHKAKGDEFGNVLLVLKKEKDIDFLTESDLENNEEHRIYYVGISRAKDRIFISVPSLEENLKDELGSGFQFEYC